MGFLAQNLYPPMMGEPGKAIGKATMLCLFLSLFAHAGAMTLVPDLERKTSQMPPQVLHVNLMSMAAPSVEPSTLEPAAGEKNTPNLEIVSVPQPKEIFVKPKSAPKPKKSIKEKPIFKKTPTDQDVKREAPPKPTILTSNDTGKKKTTVIPVIRNVHIINQNPPTYPTRARRLGQQGIVLLHVLVTADGRTKDLKVVSSSGFKSLDRSALKAVKTWTFASSQKGGEPIAAWAEVPVQFILR